MSVRTVIPCRAWANPAEVAGGTARRVIKLSNRLASGRASKGAIKPAVLGVPPEAVRHWLGHPVQPRAAGARWGVLKMTGLIKVGERLPFEGRQVLSTDDFVWAASAGWRALPIRGLGRFGDGEGEMRWVLGGRIPLSARPAPDVWGNPGRERCDHHPFGGLLQVERAFGSLTIPAGIRVGWWPGADRWERGPVPPRPHHRCGLPVIGAGGFRAVR